jgi:hypothetical protein
MISISDEADNSSSSVRGSLLRLWARMMFTSGLLPLNY